MSKVVDAVAFLLFVGMFLVWFALLAVAFRPSSDHKPSSMDIRLLQKLHRI